MGTTPHKRQTLTLYCKRIKPARRKTLVSTTNPAGATAPNHNNQKKIALINDLTGFGRCSVAVQLPVISQLGVQCCVLPTSVLSNHTGFPSYSFQDFTPHMRAHMAEWRKLDLQFRGICTGFLGSAEQIAIVSDFIDEFGGPNCCVMVDPVMGDEGRPYGTYTPEMCQRMAELTVKADVITPNLTEACILANVPYNASMTCEEAGQLAQRLATSGPARVIITGIEYGNRVANVCYERGGKPFTVETKRLGGQRSGTGDVFSAILIADAVNGVPLEQSVRKASQFVGACVQRAIELDLPHTDGLPIEEELHNLRK